MKILVDMNLSPGWVNYLAEAGFRVSPLEYDWIA